MKWMKERDALLAQALAFVESVTGKKEEPARRAPGSDGVHATVETPTSAATLEPVDVPEPAETEPPESQPTGSTAISGPVPGDFRTELRQRIATFRKHQERFNREREEYFTATLARLRAAINEPPSPRLDK